MGQNSSRQSIASSVRKRFRLKPRRPRAYSDLSATFNMLEVDMHLEQLNINSATEEELMTLPGITRTVARNILEYRQAIGTFRKVEDLALVSGVGAAKLNLIRPEICVSRRKSNLSQSSSLNPSLESIPNSIVSNNRSTKSSQFKVVNINKASMFQLMTLRGIDQELAANIVHYREKKGCFRSTDELSKVRGFSHSMIGDLRMYITVDPNSAAVEYISRTPQRTPQNSHRLFNNHRRTKSIPPKYELSNNHIFDMNDLYELLANKSLRPTNDESFSFRRNGRAALRLATWNLQMFINDKADNHGVREVICRSILENGFSLIAFQELGDKEVLEKICAELNNPCLKKVQEWQGHRGTWECVTSDAVGQMNEFLEFSGFLFDSSRGIELTDSALLTACNNDLPFPKKPFWASFQIDKTDFALVCVHLVPSCKQEVSHSPLMLNEMVDSLEKLNLGDNLLFLGDMYSSPNERDFDVFREKSYTHIIPVGTYTNINNRTMNSVKGLDNIWICKSVNKFFTGHWGVVRQGLSHLAIPQGWTWGGVVSEHCPVWAEFYVQTDGITPIANGRIKEESEINTPL